MKRSLYVNRMKIMWFVFQNAILHVLYLVVPNNK